MVHGKQIRFGKEQVAWLKSHAAAGVRVHILAVKAGTNSGPRAKRIYHWLGKDIDQVRSKGIEADPKNEWVAPVDWEDVRRQLAKS